MWPFETKKEDVGLVRALAEEGDRYAGRPLLVLLENYVLHAIGELPAEKDAPLAAIVQKVFGGGTDWKRTLRAQLRLPESIDDSIRRVWQKNQQTVNENSPPLNAIDFSKIFVDENFARMIKRRSD